jgi:hypothetical protein
MNVFNLQDIERAESYFDSVAHKFIELINEKEKEITKQKTHFIDDYYILRDKIHKKLHELYPHHEFESF